MDRPPGRPPGVGRDRRARGRPVRRPALVGLHRAAGARPRPVEGRRGAAHHHGRRQAERATASPRPRPARAGWPSNGVPAEPVVAVADRQRHPQQPDRGAEAHAAARLVDRRRRHRPLARAAGRLDGQRRRASTRSSRRPGAARPSAPGRPSCATSCARRSPTSTGRSSTAAPTRGPTLSDATRTRRRALGRRAGQALRSHRLRPRPGPRPALLGAAPARRQDPGRRAGGERLPAHPADPLAGVRAGRPRHRARRSAATPTWSRPPASRTTSATRRSATPARPRWPRSPSRPAASRATPRACGSSPGSRPRRSRRTAAASGSTSPGRRSTRPASTRGAASTDPRKFGVYADDRDVFAWLRAGAPDGRALLRGAGHGLGRRRRLLGARPRGRRPLRAPAAGRAARPGRARRPSPASRSRRHPALTERRRAARRWTGWCRCRTGRPGYDGSQRALAALKNLTSQLIGRFARAAAGRDAARPTAPRPLPRYAADLVVPAGVRAEVEVLKAVADRYVMSSDEAARRYELQTRAGARAGRPAARRRPPSPSTRSCATPGPTPPTTRARLRVVLDQVASLDRRLRRHRCARPPGAGGPAGVRMTRHG